MMSSLSGLSALIKALDRVPEQVSPIGFWWRDDDLDQSSPALLQMLAIFCLEQLIAILFGGSQTGPRM